MSNTASVPMISSGIVGCSSRHFGKRGTSHRLANAFGHVTRSGRWPTPGEADAIAAGKGVEAVPNDRKQSFACARERKRPGAPPEQGLSADVLKQSDLVADRRGCHAELGRGLSEAHTSGGGFEGTKGPERWELSHPFSLDEFNSPSD
jgi:hypothetical protein